MPIRKVLLVDDEQVFTDNMSKLLTTRGYYVTTANNGEDALKVLAERDFDVVVLDLKMPGMDGITTLKEIKKMEVFTEILILTGHGSINSALDALKLGAYDFLAKPCEIDELVEKIEGAWEKKDGAEIKDLADTINKVVESPSAALDIARRKKRNQ